MMPPGKDASLSAQMVSHSEAPAYWMLDILWTVLATSEQTEGRYSLIEQLMPQGAAPPPHVHPYGAEAFYLLEGEITYRAGNDTLDAAAGDFVVIPRNTVHSFEVKNGSARVLNFYVPGGWEQVFPDLARPADTRSLPPEGLDAHDSPKVLQFLTNYWGAPANLSFAKQKYGREGRQIPERQAFATRSATAPAISQQNARGKTLAGEDQTDEGFTLTELTVTAENEIHFAPESRFRCVYLLEGQARFQGAGLIRDAAPGTLLLMPPDDAPAALSAGAADMRLLLFAVPVPRSA